MSNTVPRHLSRHLAAVLTWQSRETIDVLIDCGVLHDERDGRGWSKIPLDEIERIRKCPVTADDFLDARASLREIRDRQPCRRPHNEPSHVAA